MNVVALHGRLARPPRERVLPSGDRLVAYEVTLQRPGERAETVPVVWLSAPAGALDLDVDDEVVVSGRVRRRFFRAQGRTESRTEVVAEAVVPIRRRKRVRALAQELSARVEGLGR